jgi:uncharacterized protein (DUF58 family)
VTAPLLEPRLLSLLARTRLRLQSALPAGGLGDRSSRVKGSGLEFIDHRPYEPGDDLRHVDPHLEARLGEAFIRQYSVDQQLPVTILLDSSASMQHGSPGKFLPALRVSAALSYLALAGSDRVRVGAFSGGAGSSARQAGVISWSGWHQGIRSATQLCAWLQQLKPQGSGSLASAAKQVLAQLPPTGLVIVVSDWLSHEDGPLPGALRRAGREVLALHLYAPDEEDPALLHSGGELHIIDSETGEEIEVSLGDQALAEYRLAWAAWREGLRESLQRQQVHYLPVSSAANLEMLLLNEWMAAGIIGR